MRDALGRAQKLGARIYTNPRCGEIHFAHALHRRTACVHGVRKDASRMLMIWLIEVERAIENWRDVLGIEEA